MSTQTEKEKNMTTLTGCINELVKDGFIDNFKIKEAQMYAPSNGKTYSATDVEIHNFYRFEGASDPEDNAVLYAISTNDGVHGMIVNAYGAYSNEEVAAFIRQVKDIEKQKPGDN